MAQEGYQTGGAPHAIIFAVVATVVICVPFLLGDSGESITSAISELLGPTGLLFLPVGLVILIRFLSSPRGTALSHVFSFGGPDSIHRVGGSPVGIALLLLVLLFLLYTRVSLFGGDDDQED